MIHDIWPFFLVNSSLEKLLKCNFAKLSDLKYFISLKASVKKIIEAVATKDNWNEIELIIDISM